MLIDYRYHELLFIIDTCQANTMYSKFYSPNIIACGSSKLDQSSYSHHADSDVGVAVIDRFTYYNLEFLETQVHDQSSKLTVGDLFDSYDEDAIHSTPGFRYDLFEGGEQAARSRLVMDFFGNVQNVESGNVTASNGSTWLEDLADLERFVEAMAKANETASAAELREPEADLSTGDADSSAGLYEAPFGLDVMPGMRMKLLGGTVLVGGLSLWLAGNMMKSKN